VQDRLAAWVVLTLIALRGLAMGSPSQAGTTRYTIGFGLLPTRAPDAPSLKGRVQRVAFALQQRPGALANASSPPRLRRGHRRPTGRAPS
jgi:hypothetical protein